MSLKVLFDLRMWNWSGIGRYSTNLARHLSKQATKKQISIEYLKLSNDEKIDKTLDVLNPNFHQTNVKPFSLFEYTGRGLNFFLNFNIVHIPHFVIPVRKRTNMVTTIHDVIPLFYPVTSKSKRILIRHWIGKALELSNLVICVSKKVKNDINCVFGVDGEKIRVIYEAPDDYFFTNEGMVPLERLAGRDFFLVFGNWKRHKGLDIVISAFHSLGNRLLVVVGNPPFAGEVEKSVVRKLHELEERELIIFTGRVSDGELKWLYRNCVAFIHPSRDEGFGLPPLEAMACGAAVISSNIPTSLEVLEQNALYYEVENSFELAQRIDQISNDPELLNNLKILSLEHARKFSWEKTAERTIECYFEVAAGSN